MSLKLLQILDESNQKAVIALENNEAFKINNIGSIYELAKLAIKNQISINEQIKALGHGDKIDIDAAKKIIPIEHPDPSHLIVAGTGLTHLGSAEGRQRMHETAQSDPNSLTDSMRMFLMGVEGGKPKAGEKGVQPEWFYKGNGYSLITSEETIESPSFALDGGEEPEIAGIYIIADDGTPFRIGFTLANEFSDHVTEKQNYLWLAHSKLRVASIGYEILVGDLPENIDGNVSIKRNGETIWSKPFITGESNMAHSIANLEYHHFKNPVFRIPGDIHVHCFGTMVASFGDGIKTQDGDEFIISATPFKFALANRFETASEESINIKVL